MAESEHEELTIRAGEYVLGLLDQSEREQFETELRESDDSRREVDYWERRLGAMGLALAPVQPPQALWARIASAVGISPGADRERTARRGEPATRNGGAGMFWRGLAMAASVAAIVMAGLLLTQSSERPETQTPEQNQAPAYASIVYDEPTGTSWLVTVSQGSQQMSVTAMGDYDVPNGKILRAWFKPENGKPMLLGQWPHTRGKHVMTVSDTVAKAMDQPAKLLVSLEDAANAGKPAPHGKVMWSAPIARHTS